MICKELQFKNRFSPSLRSSFGCPSSLAGITVLDCFNYLPCQFPVLPTDSQGMNCMSFTYSASNIKRQTKYSGCARTKPRLSKTSASLQSRRSVSTQNVVSETSAVLRWRRSKNGQWTTVLKSQPELILIKRSDAFCDNMRLALRISSLSLSFETPIICETFSDKTVSR